MSWYCWPVVDDDEPDGDEGVAGVVELGELLELELPVLLSTNPEPPVPLALLSAR
jgi:hypothetical protein